MKVLHVNQLLEWAGGVETYLLSLVPALESLGYKQCVAFESGRGELVSRSRRISGLSGATRSQVTQVGEEIAILLDEFQPDIVHIHSVHNVGVMEACLGRVPVIMHGHDYRYLCPSSSFYYRRTQEICTRTAGPGCFPTTLRKHCLSPRPAYAWNYYRRVKWIEKRASRFAYVVAPSDAARNRFLEAGFPESNVVTLPYFCPVVPLDRPRRLPSDTSILFIGRIRPTKGVDVFVDAFSKLPDSVKATMVGDFTAESRGRLERRVSTLGCRERLDMRSWAGRDKIAEIFRQASVFVFPSIWPETLGIVGIEALACGVPVVASDVGGVREWLLPERTGILVPPKSVDATASAMERLLFDEPLNRAMGENGIELVRDKFSLARHIDELKSLYENGVEHGAKRIA